MQIVYSVHIDSVEHPLSEYDIKKLCNLARIKCEGTSVVADMASILYCKLEVPQTMTIDEIILAHGFVGTIITFCKRTKSKYSIRVMGSDKSIRFFDG